MRCLFFSIFALFLMQSVSAQTLTSADTSYILDKMLFPSANIEFTFQYSGSMLDINTPMQPHSYKSEEELIEKLKQDSNNVENIVELFDYYRSNGRGQQAYPLMEKALALAIQQFEANKADIKAARNLTQILSTIQRHDGAVQVWGEYTKQQANDPEGWWQYSISNVQLGDLTQAKYGLLKAYKLNPSAFGIYVAEMTHQIYSQLYFSKDTTPPFVFDFDRSFFEKAANENPNLATPRLALAGLDVVGVFFETIIDQGDNFQNREVFKWKLSSINKKTIKSTDAYFQGLLKKGYKNPYYFYKNLMAMAIIQNNNELAEAYFQKATQIIDEDPNLHKIMAFAYMPSRDWAKSASHLENAIKTARGVASVTDQLALAKLYFENKEYDKSLSLLSKLNADNDLIGNGDFRAAYGILTIMTKKGEWLAALGVLDALLELRPDAAEEPNFAWYQGCFNLLLGNRDAARTAFEQIAKDSQHYFNKEAKDLLERY